MSILDAPIARLDGTAATLGEITGGRPALLVNVASKCGLTPQYAGPRAAPGEVRRPRLHRGRPAVQPVRRPGARQPEEIAEFCSATYGVTLPDDREDRGQRRGAGTRSTRDAGRDAQREGRGRRHHLELREVPRRRRRRGRRPLPPQVVPDDPALVDASSPCSAEPTRHSWLPKTADPSLLVAETGRPGRRTRPRSGLHRQRQREHGVGARRRRARAASVSVQPVTTRSSTSSTGARRATSASSAAAARHRGHPLGGVGRALAGRDVGVDDRPAADHRHLQVAGQPVGEVARSAWAGSRTRRTTIAVDRAAASRRAPRCTA